jgi:hypothetical protein
MKQVKTKFRNTWAGIIFAAALAVTGGCGDAGIPTPEEEDTSGRIGKKEGDMVLVRITTPDTAALSILPNDVPNYVNFWEVVFKSSSDNPAYYRGTGTPLSRGNSIDVAVPIGNGYTVLLLGGDRETKTLLAVGIKENQQIKANEENLVTISVEKVVLRWDGDTDDISSGDNFAFSGTISGSYANISVTDKVVQFGEPDEVGSIGINDVLKVTVDLSGMMDVAQLDQSSDEPLIQLESDSYISLRPRKNGGKMLDYVPDIESSISYTDGSNTYNNAITTDHGGMEFTIPRVTAEGKLPNYDVDMVLDIVLRYRAFSDVDDAIVWTIANGIYGEPDNSTDGSKTVLNGGIIVRFGKGSSDTGEGETITRVKTPSFTPPPSS